MTRHKKISRHKPLRTAAKSQAQINKLRLKNFDKELCKQPAVPNTSNNNIGSTNLKPSFLFLPRTFTTTALANSASILNMQRNRLLWQNYFLRYENAILLRRSPNNERNRLGQRQRNAPYTFEESESNWFQLDRRARINYDSWKIHVSVNEKDIPKAWNALIDFAVENEIGAAKVASPRNLLFLREPPHFGKAIVFYHTGKLPPQAFAFNIEKILLENKIRPGPGISYAAQINGSRYQYYRYPLDRDGRYVGDTSIIGRQHNLAGVPDPFENVDVSAAKLTRGQAIVNKLTSSHTLSIASLGLSSYNLYSSYKNYNMIIGLKGENAPEARKAGFNFKLTSANEAVNMGTVATTYAPQVIYAGSKAAPALAEALPYAEAIAQKAGPIGIVAGAALMAATPVWQEQYDKYADGKQSGTAALIKSTIGLEAYASDYYARKITDYVMNLPSRFMKNSHDNQADAQAYVDGKMALATYMDRSIRRSFNAPGSDLPLSPVGIVASAYNGARWLLGYKEDDIDQPEKPAYSSSTTIPWEN
jgi:hypothetical protein